jgi:hypothetical protein
LHFQTGSSCNTHATIDRTWWNMAWNLLVMEAS